VTVPPFTHFHAQNALLVDKFPARRMGHGAVRNWFTTVRSRALKCMSWTRRNGACIAYFSPCPRHLPRSRTRLPGGDMSSSERATTAASARVSADPRGRDTGRSLAGLIDVLDRADLGSVNGRTRRAAVHRSAGARSGSVRTVPLRSVQPAPMARPLPGSAPAPQPAGGRLRALTRRVALWGAGPGGEYLAWRSPAPPVHSPGRQAAVPAASRRPARLRGLVRRVALWGAGPRGEYLAWGAPARPAPKRDADRPVVLLEMPSTPTVQPAAPSPAAALLPRGPASSAGPQGMPPVPRGAVAVPGVRPSGRPERSQATGWPPQARSPGAAPGLVRARGDPLGCPVRGSPPPARRSRSPGSVWSSFP
jgi:hypothetical protein